VPTRKGCGSFETHVTKAALRELAWARLQTYESWVLHTYNLLPTDPRFLDLTPWQCEYLYWSRTMWGRLGKLLAEKRPATKLEHVLAEEFFEEELERREAESEREAAESEREGKEALDALERAQAERAQAPPDEVEHVSSWKASGPSPGS
jgi:hypothetical protein